MSGKNRFFPSGLKSGTTLSSQLRTAHCLQSSDPEQPPQVRMHLSAFSLLPRVLLLRWGALHIWPQPPDLVSAGVKVESGESLSPRLSILWVLL